MADEVDWHLSFERAVPLQANGEHVGCTSYYMGINEDCPREGTHVVVYDLVEWEDGDRKSKGTVKLPRCDECGRPDSVDTDAPPEEPKYGTSS